VANKAGGKGFENSEGYPSCKLVFHGIQNIHAMRESLAGLVKSRADNSCPCAVVVLTFFVTQGFLTSSSAVQNMDAPMPQYLSNLESCGWLKHVRSVLETTVQIVNYITQGSSVIIHCR
jgi:myotubularin-related protein 6/7/8